MEVFQQTSEVHGDEDQIQTSF